MATVLKLKSSDDEIFEIEQQVISQSQMIKNIVEDLVSPAGEIPLRISSQVLAKVLEWCKKHHQDDENDDKNKKTEEEVKKWENKFAEELSDDTDLLYDLILAANFLNVPALLDRLCKTAADMMKGKTPEEIRQIFNIKNDFTAEEESEIMNEQSWAF